MTDFIIWIPESISLSSQEIVAEAAVPLLPASKIGSGVLHPDRLPAIPASKIEGQLLPDQLPPIDEGELDQAVINAVLAQHLATADPHPQYVQEVELGTAAYQAVEAFAPAVGPVQAVANHVSAEDPHPQYALESSLGSAAAQPVSAFASAAQGVLAQSALQPASLTAVDPNDTLQAYGRSLVPLMDTPGGRLTLVSGDPIPSGNVTSATIYYAPYLHDRLPVRQGGKWVSRQFSEVSLSLSAGSHPANTVHDVVAAPAAAGGGLALSTIPWASATARNLPLSRSNGIWVDNQERVYLGTIAMTTTAGQAESSETNRLVWNAYNRRPRVLKRYETVSTWTCNVLWRPWNSNTANRFTVVCGMVEEPIDVLFSGRIDTPVSAYGYLGIGLDATAAYTGLRVVAGGQATVNTLCVRFCRYLSLGRHFLQALEAASGGTITLTGIDYGMEGIWWS